MPDADRIHELVALIDIEKDPDRLERLAAELGQLLTASGQSWPTHEKPRSD